MQQQWILTPSKPNFWARGARDIRLKNATRKSDRQYYDICCTMVFFPVVGLFDYVHITSTHTWLCHNLSLYKDISFLNCITCNLNIICLYLLQKLIRAQCKFFVGKNRYIVPPKWHSWDTHCIDLHWHEKFWEREKGATALLRSGQDSIFPH